MQFLADSSFVCASPTVGTGLGVADMLRVVRKFASG